MCGTTIPIILRPLSPLLVKNTGTPVEHTKPGKAGWRLQSQNPLNAMTFPSEWVPIGFGLLRCVMAKSTFDKCPVVLKSKGIWVRIGFFIELQKFPNDTALHLTGHPSCQVKKQRNNNNNNLNKSAYFCGGYQISRGGEGVIIAPEIHHLVQLDSCSCIPKIVTSFIFASALSLIDELAMKMSLV